MNQSRRSLSRISWEGTVILVLLLQVFAIQWLSYTKYYCLIIDGVLILYLLLHPGWFHKMKKSIIPVVLYFVYCLYHGVRSGSKTKILLANMYPVTSALLIIFALFYINTRRHEIKRTFSGLFPLINGYMILNIPVLLLQLNDHFELSGRHAAENTSYFKPDLISGLFGYYGTPMLAVFSAFFFIYDLWYFRYYIQKRQKPFFLVYYSAMFFFYLYISVKNENNGYFLILGMFFVLYYLSVQNNYRKIIQKIKRRIKGILLIIAGLAAVFAGYRYIAPVQKIIDKYIKNYNLGTSTYDAGGSTVRFATVSYFLNNKVNKLFGAGIGTMEWKEDYGFGFKNFGQSDLGSFLLIGGFLFVLLLTGIFACSAYTDNKSGFMTFCECGLLLVLLLYTQPFTSISIMISFMLFILVCGMEKDAANRKGFSKLAGIAFAV